jgi:hypothetical protein
VNHGPILLKVEGEEFVIDWNEAGEPMIRKRRAALIERDNSCTAHWDKQTNEGVGHPVLLEVEALS